MSTSNDQINMQVLAQTIISNFSSLVFASVACGFWL